MDDDSWEDTFMTAAARDIQEDIERHGLKGIEEFYKSKLGRWEDVEINVGVTGDVCAGKSTFTNKIRGLADDDELAAETGAMETTEKEIAYPHPTHPKIKFWDLPGIGTPQCSDLSTYYTKVKMKKFDIFLIFIAGPFTRNHLDLAKKLKDIDKSFFFIRTKIDADYFGQKRKKGFKEEVMLQEMREKYRKHLQENRDIFLISNLYTERWDFPRLTQAILDVLPILQKESLMLSLGRLTSLSSDMLRRKANCLRGRIWMVAAASAAAASAAAALPELTVLVDVVLIRNEINIYKSQLGLPEVDSPVFQRMTPENQENVREFWVSGATQLVSLISGYVDQAAVEKFARFIPLVGSGIVGGISFHSTYYFLHECLDKFEKTALEFLDEETRKATEDFDINN